MEICNYLISVIVMTSLIVIATSMSIPDVQQISDNELQAVDEQKDFDKRATWMNTRELEDDFVNLVEMSLHKLASEGRVNPELVPAPPANSNSLKQKRGKFQGFCFRKTSTGRYLPYVCWKSGDVASMDSNLFDRRRK